MASEYTREEVEKAITGPIEQRVDGKYGCRVCPRYFDSKRSVPVHEIVHRRAVGLAPPAARGGLPESPRTVICQYNGCTERMFRTSLPTHLRSKKHGLSQADASFWARKRGDEDRGIGLAVVVLDEEVAEPPESRMTDLTAVEAVTGILSAARRDGQIPVRLLPAAHNLIEHTGSVLDELRRLTDG